ncbi:SGNH/GDSL hydrolase family protein [Candidatus Magnetominusculus dajiuhuensis]|uniref:SGNH/GDSL hydrolase family protein n=1 Tax=Candidatus Magnetominusculus dajiuhuensis TaxID=3137712 RepID=UPI003B42998E
MKTVHFVYGRFIAAIVVVCFYSIVSSEIVFFLFKGGLYAKMNNYKSASGNKDEMKIYREPFSVQKGKRFRILAIGGSTTYGVGVDAVFTWPHLLQEKLDSNFPGKYEVINLGIKGGHLEEYIQNYYASLTDFISKGDWDSNLVNGTLKAAHANWGWKDLNPDLIVMAPTIADMMNDFGSERNRIAVLAQYLLRRLDGTWFSQNAALGFYMSKELATIDFNNRTEPSNEAQKLQVIQKDYSNHLEQFISLWKKDIPIYLIGFPVLFKATDDNHDVEKAARYWSIQDKADLYKNAALLPKFVDMGQKIENAIAVKYKIHYKEIGEEISMLPFNDRLEYYSDSIHMKSKGTHILAEQIYDFLFPDNLSKCLIINGVNSNAI